MNNYCRLQHRTITKQLEVNLPIRRIQKEVFESASFDYCRSFFIKMEWRPSSKSKTTTKQWVLVIICHSLIAIHLEMAYDYTTDHFLLALKRFANRRSILKGIHLDCAKEFIKEKSTIESMFDKLNNESTQQRLHEE